MKSVLTLVLFAAVLQAKDRAWQDGTLTDVTQHIEQDHINSPYRSGRMVLDVPMTAYTVQSGGRFVVGERAFMGRQTGIDVDVNGPIRFCIDKNYMYIQDKAGKEWKLLITKQGFQKG